MTIARSVLVKLGTFRDAFCSLGTAKKLSSACMDPWNMTETSSSASITNGNQPEDGSLAAYNEEMLRQAETQCELTIRQTNIRKLKEDISVLAKEVKREYLAERWGRSPRSDGSRRVKPEIQAAALCNEVAANPDILDDVLMKLQYEKAKLQSEVAEVMSKLKDYEVAS